MAAATTGAVFFLGTRAHYQVLQQPATQYDAENGNASPESYRCRDSKVTDDREMGTGVKRRFSKTTEVDREDMKPALLNDEDNATPKKPARARPAVLSLFSSLGRRTRTVSNEHQLRQLESALTGCTYRESCRCLDCQSSYFDCDESDDDNYNSSGDSDYDCEFGYSPNYDLEDQPQSDDDEIFVNHAPNDNTSTDLLIDGKGQTQGQVKMSTSSDEINADELQIEVAAGTPVFLNYLLTHPVTCCIQ